MLNVIFLELVTLGVTTFYVARAVYRLFFHPLAKVPGPWYLAVSSVPNSYYVCLSGQWHIVNKKLHEQYGPIIRVSPNGISVDGTIGWKAVYGHRPHGKAEWSKWPEFFSGVPKDIVTAETEDHRRMRKQIIRAFSDRAVMEQQPIIRKYSDQLILRLKERTKTAVDISKWLNFYTFDTFGDLAFGDPFGSLDSGEYHPWVSLIFDTIKVTKMFRFLDEAKWITPIARALTPEDLKRRSMEHYNLSKSKFRDRLQRGATSRKDFMSHILDAHGDKTMTEDELEANVGTLIPAGSETTATLLSGLLYLLLKNPEKYTRLTEEIRSTFKDGDDAITLQSVSSMPYLQACIEEALRLYPPVPIGAPRQVPSGGDYLQNLFLPAKTVVEVPQWATHRSALSFTDPDEFVPERWLQADHKFFQSKYEHDNRSVVQPFSYGPRNCLGKTLAYYEMKFIIALLFNNMDFELVPEADRWIERSQHYFFWLKPPLLVNIKTRL